jgi:two-component system, NtrC family, response regulator AtoC
MSYRHDDSTTAEGGAANPKGPAAASGRFSLVLYHADGVAAAELQEGRPLVVGRSSACDLHVDLKQLSRRHAQFVREQDAVEVVDLDSRNGTFVDGERVRRAQLRPGSVITLGDPHWGMAVLVERLRSHTVGDSSLALRRPLGYDSFRNELTCAANDARIRGQSLALLMLRASAPGARAHLGQWASSALARIDQCRAAGVYDAQTMLVLLIGLESERVRELAHMLTRALDDHGVVCGVAVLPGVAASCEELLHSAQRACLSAGPGNRVAFAQLELASAPAPDVEHVVIQSPAMSELYRLITRVAPTDVTVLISGETGTGKEVIANSLHRLSSRRNGPFRAVNCAAIPSGLLEATLFGHEKGAFTGATRSAKGLFEQADGGTIFLDEVGELSPALQAALLRALESKRIMRVGAEAEVQLDVRILAATHRELERMVASEQFRNDLWYRLSAIELHVPPLRDRSEEIAPLIHHFMSLAGSRFDRRVDGVDDEAMARLLAYRWPGNVRELRNVIERAVLLARAPVLTLDDLPERVRAQAPLDAGSALALVPEGSYQDRVREYEVRLIEEGLRIAENNQSRAAQLLKIPLRTLSRKIKQYAIKSRKKEP